MGLRWSDIIKSKNALTEKKDGYFQYAFNTKPSDSGVTATDKRKSFYEDLMYIGTKDDTGVSTPDSKIAAECLKEYMHGFTERILFIGQNSIDWHPK